MAALAFRYTMIAVGPGLIAALAFGAAGCSTDSQRPAPEASGDGKDFTTPDADGSLEKELNNPLLQAMDKALETADDLDGSEKNEAHTILGKADPVLTRIKQENREALRRANHPPRKARPTREKQEEES